MVPLKFPDDSFWFEPIFHCFISSCLDFRILQGVVWQLQENQPVIIFFSILKFSDLTIRLKQYTYFARAGMLAPFSCELAAIKNFDSIIVLPSVVLDINVSIFPADAPILFYCKSLHLSPVLFSPFWLLGRGGSALCSV